jgi:transcription antitermination factor NusG
VPLFTSYVFVRVLSKDSRAVLETDNVVNFVYWLRKPAVIRDEEISAIREYLWKHENVELERIKVDLNDKVRIKNGPFMSKEGKITDIQRKTVKILLPSLGYALVVSVDKDQIEKVDTIKKDLLLASS